MSDLTTGTISPDRVRHIVINVSDLERSIDFYEATLPVTRSERFEVLDQPLPELGVERGSFKGCVLRGTNVPESCEVHLVQWLDPAPDASAARDFFEPGLYRLCFHSPDVPGRYDDVVRASGRPFSEPLAPYPGRTTGRPVFGFRDPDGVVLEYVTMDGPERIYHVNHNTVDLAATKQLMEAHLGLECPITFDSGAPGPSAFTESDEDTVVVAGLFSVPPTPDRPKWTEFYLDVCQWTTPITDGRDGHSQTAIGLSRVGIEVASVGEAHARLQGLPGVSTSQPASWNLGSRPHFMATVCDGLVVEFTEPSRA
jgi:catechol 2,3-dioxygenase-like lactoylglutathione lyase family enzyme